MRPVARAIVGNLLWSADGGVWAWWTVTPLPYGHAPRRRRDAVRARMRRLVETLPAEATLLSVCERVDGVALAAAMSGEVDVAGHPAWAEACAATGRWGDDVAVYRRRHHLGVRLAPHRAPWRDMLRTASAEVAAVFGLSPLPIPASEVDAVAAQAADVEVALAAHLPLRRVSAGELCWLVARALGRAPSYDLGWEPRRALRAHLGDATVTEGAGSRANGSPDPVGSRSVRVDGAGGPSWHTTLVLADLTQDVPGTSAASSTAGAGPAWLFDVDRVGFPVDWCVHWRDGEATVLLSLTASSLTELDDRADALLDRYLPRDHRLSRPVRGQAALLRATLPGAGARGAHGLVGPQRIEPDELAAAIPFGSREVGDGRGGLLGISLDGGTGTPVLFDPSSLAAVGNPGSGVSYLFKRLVWDTVALGGQVVVVDRTPDGEHAAFARAVSGRARVVRIHEGRPLGGVGVEAANADAADLVVLWAPLAGDDEVAALVTQAMRVVAADPARFGAVVLEDAGSLLEDPAGRAGLVDELRRGARGNAGLWLGADTPDQLLGDDLAGLAARFVLDQAAEDVPVALRWLGLDPDDPGMVDTMAPLLVGLAPGQCLLRDGRGRVGLVQVLPPLIPGLQAALEADEARVLAEGVAT
jgi:AAA domain-containing protein